MSTNLEEIRYILLDEAYLRIERLPARRLLHLTWKGHARSDQYRSALLLALKEMQEHEVHYRLADLRNMTAILHADEQWANEVWFPQLFATGLRRMAIVESRDFFNQTSVERSFTAVNGKLTFGVAWFRKPEEATAWSERDQARSA